MKWEVRSFNDYGKQDYKLGTVEADYEAKAAEIANQKFQGEDGEIYVRPMHDKPAKAIPGNYEFNVASGKQETTLFLVFDSKQDTLFELGTKILAAATGRPRDTYRIPIQGKLTKVTE